MNIKIKKFISFLLIIAISISLTGCWSNRPLNKRAFVVAVGVDKGENQDMKVTIQMVNPSALNPQKAKGDLETTTWVLSINGNTPFEAIRKALTTINRKPFYSHMQLLVIGDKLAKDGVEDFIDLFERDPEIRLSYYILVAKDTTAERILNAQSQLELIPALHLTQIIENNPEANPQITSRKMIDLLKDFNHKGIEATTGVVSIRNEKEELLIKDLEVSGAAVFNGSKVVGYLPPLNTEGLASILDQSKSTILPIPNPLDEEKKVSIEQTKLSSNIDVKLVDGKFKGYITVVSEGNIGGQQGQGDLTTQENLDKLEDETIKYMKNQIISTIKLAQDEYKSDIFGFGKIVHRNYNHVWKDVENDWNDYFSKMDIEVTIIFNIRNTGLITKPSEY